VDSSRRVLCAVQIFSGTNRVTLLAHLSRQTQCHGLAGRAFRRHHRAAAAEGEQPLIFNRINIAFRFDTDRKRVLLTQADLSHGEISVAGTGVVDYSGEPRLQPRLCRHADVGLRPETGVPILIAPEVREWVIERIEKGAACSASHRHQFPVRTSRARGRRFRMKGFRSISSPRA